MINTGLKWLKIFLVSKFRKIDFPIARIFCARVKFSDFLFFDFLDLDKFLTVSLVLLPPSQITLFSSVLNTFKANISDNLVVFNIEVNDAAILLKF